MKNLILISASLLAITASAKQPDIQEPSVSGGQGANHCRAVCVATGGQGLVSMSFMGSILINGYGDSDIKALNAAIAQCRTFDFGAGSRSDLVVSYSIGNKQIGTQVIEGQYVKDMVPANAENCRVK